MASASVENVFSIPFRYLWNAQFSGELVDQGETASALARFVGDDRNKVLRVLSTEIPGFISRTNQPIWPLVLFGATGTGKTSLALTIISNIATEFEPPPSSDQRVRRPEKPLVLTSLDFDRRFRAALETDSVPDFRRRLLRCSGLVIDDLQKLSQKLAAQHELLQVIDQMLVRDRPLVLTINQDPQRVDGLVPSLASRLSSGLALPVYAPGRDARAVIIGDLCRIHRLELTESAQALLVDRLDVTVPKMIHFFNQLKINLQAEQVPAKAEPPASSVGSPIDVAQLTRIFSRSETDVEQLSRIIATRVAAEMQVKLADLKGHSRKQTIVQARAIAIYLNRKLLGSSFTKIGAMFGNRDHSTIMHAYRKIESLFLSAEPDLDQAVVTTKHKIEKIDQELTNQFAGQINI